MSRGNGRRPERPDPDERQRRQEETQLLGAAAETAAREHGAAPSIQESFLEDLLDTSGLEDPSKELLQNLLSKNLMLGNLSAEEKHEMKYRLKLRELMFIHIHPRQEGVSGPERAYVNDDPTDRLKPLTQEQKLAATQLFDAIWLNVTRAEDMKQQEILQTSITESYVQRGDDDGDESKSGLMDYLPGVGGS